MRKLTFKVHKAGFGSDTENLTRLVDVEVELSDPNYQRFSIDPRQETLWDTYRFSGTDLSLDEWLTKYCHWEKEAKSFRFEKAET
jgi:hypothetical protein